MLISGNLLFGKIAVIFVNLVQTRLYMCVGQTLHASRSDPLVLYGRPLNLLFHHMNPHNPS